MSRSQLTNPQAILQLQYNPYQQSFLAARRMRVCPNLCATAAGVRLSWSMLEHGLYCPRCQAPGLRAFRRLFLRAGRQSGKTRVGALSAIEEALTVPGSVGWCSAPSYPELRDYVLPAFFSQFPSDIFDHPATKWWDDRMTLVLPNESQVHFRSLDDPNRATGATLDWWWIDEGRKINALAWGLGEAMLVVKDGVAWITSSPDWGEDWCHKTFWVNAENGVPGFWACTYKTVDSPVIKPEIIEMARQTMPPELFRREYEASIEFPTGTIYGDVINRCDCDDAKIAEWIPEWPLVSPQRPMYIPLDPGTDHPFAGVVIVGTPKGLVFVGEYKQRNMKFVEHAGGLRHLLTRINPTAALTPQWLIDKSAKQAALELTNYGIYAAGAENDVDAGIERLYSWMASNRLRIARSRCPELLKELRGYRYAEIPEGARGLSKPTPYKKDDDLADCARYGVMAYPELPTVDIDLSAGPNMRDLSLLSPDDRRQIERMMAFDKDEPGNLTRVTDDYTMNPLDDIDNERGPLGDFYS